MKLVLSLSRIALATLLSLAPSLLTSQTSEQRKTPIAATAATAVPALVPYSGVIAGMPGRAGSQAGAATEVGITFLVFRDERRRSSPSSCMVSHEMASYNVTSNGIASLFSKLWKWRN